jgi:hypothetical protein
MRAGISIFRRIPFLLTAVCAAFSAPQEIVVDFENAAVAVANDKAHRVEQWVEKDVTFKLAHEPRQTKAKGLVMFFGHLSSGHKGIASAMALEPIPVRATFPAPVSSVTVALWGSTGTPAQLEAYDAEGKMVDRASVASVPGRKAPGDPVPIFTLTVRGPRIAYVEFAGPRAGEYLVADEVRFTPVESTSR